jgi:hypothetical protein
VPTRKGKEGRAPFRPRPDRKPEAIGKLIGRLGADSTQRVTFRDGPDGEPVTSRFIFARVHAAHGWRDDQRRSGWREGAEVPPREEWLIAEWPDGHDAPTDYWISNLPADTEPERLARLARMRWKMELDYKQLKGELGLDHYEGRSLARLAPPHSPRDRRPRVSHPRAAEPFSPAAGLTLPKVVLLMQPIFKCWTGRCQTCRQPVDLTHLALSLSRHDE